MDFRSKIYLGSKLILLNRTPVFPFSQQVTGPCPLVELLYPFISPFQNSENITHRLCGEVDHLLERELGADVAVHDEEGVGVAGEDAVPEVVDAAGGAQRGVLLE